MTVLDIILNFIEEKKKIEKKTGKYCKKYNKQIANLFLKNY